MKLDDLFGQWWTSARNTESLRRFVESRGLAVWVRGMISLLTVLITSVGVISLVSPSGVQGGDSVARGVVVGVCIVALLWGVRWNVGPWPAFRESATFLAFADASVVLICLFESNLLAGLTGAAVLALLGTYATFFLGPRVLVIHLAWCCVAIALLSGRVAVDPQFGIELALAKALILIASCIIVPVLIELGIYLIRVDAERSFIDPLTGLTNRRGLTAGLTRLQMEAHRYIDQFPVVAVVVLDLDNFKRVNDQWGHHTGDQVLVRTARRLARVCGPRSVISRYGGEEFLVLELHRDLDSVIAAAQAIRAAVAVHDPSPSVTASVGVTVTDTHSLGLGRVETVEQVVHDAVTRADSAMYRAKRAGGDRVEVEPHPREWSFRLQ